MLSSHVCQRSGQSAAFAHVCMRARHAAAAGWGDQCTQGTARLLRPKTLMHKGLAVESRSGSGHYLLPNSVHLPVRCGKSGRLRVSVTAIIHGVCLFSQSGKIGNLWLDHLSPEVGTARLHPPFPTPGGGPPVSAEWYALAQPMGQPALRCFASCWPSCQGCSPLTHAAAPRGLSAVETSEADIQGTARLGQREAMCTPCNSSSGFEPKPYLNCRLKPRRRSKCASEHRL